MSGLSLRWACTVDHVMSGASAAIHGYSLWMEHLAVAAVFVVNCASHTTVMMLSLSGVSGSPAASAS